MAGFNKAKGARFPSNKAGRPLSTYEGGPGFQRSAQHELFLLAVSYVNEDTFYEAPEGREDRIRELTRQVSDDPQWLVNLITWLRSESGMRTVPTLIAVCAVHARLKAGLHGDNRKMIRAAIGRLDEVGEVLAAWDNVSGGAALPSAVKRGVADALRDLMNESSYLKWRGKGDLYSLNDAVVLTHPKPRDARQSALFKYAIDAHYGVAGDLTKLPIVESRNRFLALGKDDQIRLLSDPETAHNLIRDARLTHEVIAGAIGTIPGEVWDNLVDHMSVVAQRMNLRRIFDSGASKVTISKLIERVGDHREVISSKTFPMSVQSAYISSPEVFQDALASAMDACLANVPQLPGKTLILVDFSGSMGMSISRFSQRTYGDLANLFALTLAMRAEDADIVLFDDRVADFELDEDASLLDNWKRMPRPRCGTDMAGAIKSRYTPDYDRVLAITDEQVGSFWGRNESVSDVARTMGANIIIWNLCGYPASALDDAPENQIMLGGLNDASAKVLVALESGVWPWEVEAA